MSNNSSAFTIYNASAGSGKTYTLVKNYLLKILASATTNRYQQILAVTFTNKAVAEMKTRIIGSLHGFSKATIEDSHQSMFNEIKQELNLTTNKLQKKSKKVLHHLLHNYTAFNVQTIDKFTQSVIRTFAFDLNLNHNFEVELDSKKVLEQAVDELLNQVGQNPDITKIVLNFMKSNITDDSTWNIKNSLIDTAKIIINENDIPYLKRLETKTINDFQNLKNNLTKKIDTNKYWIQQQSSDLLMQLEQEGIIDHFNRNTLPNHFRKLKQEGTTTFSKTTKWQQGIENYNFYTKSCPEHAKNIIDALRPYIENLFYSTKKKVIENEYIFRILKNITQMSLLKTVHLIIEKLKKEQNFLLISDFNQLIFETIKNQPTPFIYERLGEKFKDFYIDEFQDTSEMQWQNLIPLADNAVSSIIENTNETGSITLVGDAKQAIYRWRGGKAEQFINLYQGKAQPFANPNKKIENLNTNYRSYATIIQFNNNFFTYLSNHFSNPIYKELYLEGNQQHENSKKGGYVQFDFINGKNNTEKDQLYIEKTEALIHQILKNGFTYGAISILVRKNSQGVLLANYLSHKNIPVISSESLLLKNAAVIQLLISYSYYTTNTNDIALKLDFLKALAVYLKIDIVNPFLLEAIKYDFTQLKVLCFKQFGINILSNPFEGNSIYEAFEKCIAGFKLHTKATSYIQFFLDFVFEYAQKINMGIVHFLTHWETKKESLSIVVPETKNAIQILSIHKSKGLEFPVVIYPFADTDIYKNKPQNIWLPINEFSEVFSEAYISYNKTLFEQYAKHTIEAQNNITELQELDNFNVLYVALTRAKEQLYIISNHNKDAKSIPTGSFQSYFLDFLATQNTNSLDANNFYFGNPQKKQPKKETNGTNNIVLKSFLSSNKLNHGIRQIIPKHPINAKQAQAIDKGKMVHEIFSEIFDRSDVKKVLNHYKCIIAKNEFKELKKNITYIVNHKEFKTIFNTKNKIYNEREFIHERNILRPDRVEINENKELYILDYKTGKKEAKYLEQIKKYEAIFKKKNLKLIKKYIIYIDTHPIVEEIKP